MVPKLDDDGNRIPAKKPKENQKPWKEKQTLMQMPQEFYLTERKEIEAFVKTYALNEKDVDYAAFFVDIEARAKAAAEDAKAEESSLVNKDGTKLVVAK